MAPPATIDIESRAFGANDVLFLDANVWLFVYCSEAANLGGERAQIYIRAFVKIRAAKSRLYVDMLVISEFANAYARLEYDAARKEGAIPPCKLSEFRKSPAFSPIAKKIAEDIRDILSRATLIGSALSKTDIESLLDVYQKGGADFNDLVIAKLCEKRRFSLATDDSGFDGQPFPVITANKSLLARRR